MYKVIETDKVVDDLHINLLIIDLNPQFVDVDQVLAQNERPNPQLCLILHLVLGDYEFPLDGLRLGLDGVVFGDVVDVVGWEVVGEVGLEEEWGLAGVLLARDDATHWS